MRRVLGIVSVGLCWVLLAGAAWSAPESMTEQEKRSYALGANIGKNVKEAEPTAIPAFVAKGLVDVLEGKSQLSDAEIVAIVEQAGKEAQERAKTERTKAADENYRRGKAFLAENAKKDGIKVLPSGVQYRVLQEGKGNKPIPEDYVLCNYAGKLLDGTVFDASQPGKPSAFNLAKVIPGWREALTQMPVGSKWELFIPPEKAYGTRGSGKKIGPNETLIFEVELVEIK